MATVDTLNLIMCFVLILIVIPTCIFLFHLIKESTVDPEYGIRDEDFYSYRTFKGKVHSEGIYGKLDMLSKKNLDLKDYTEKAYRQLEKIGALSSMVKDLDYVFDYPRATIANSNALVGGMVDSSLQYLRGKIMANCRQMINSITSCDIKVEDITLEDLNTDELDSLLKDNKEKINLAVDIITCYFRSDGKGGRKFDGNKFNKIVSANFDQE